MVVRARRARMNPSIDEGLVLHLPLSEGSGSKAWDRSPYQNHGTLLGTPTWFNGARGMCLDFDSDADYVDLGTHTSLELQNFTISMWVTSSDWASSGLIYGGNYSGNKGVGIYSNTAAAGHILWVGNGTTKYYSLWGNNPIPTGTLIHLTVIKDGAVVTLYYNGVFIKSSVLTSGTIDYSAGNIRYLGRGLTSTFGHRGIIDEVRIYNRCLSPIEIRILYSMRGWL